jgi:hypothetical protein
MSPKPALTLTPYNLTIHRFAANAALPPPVVNSPFFAVTRTADELSVVCTADIALSSDQAERDWRCLKVEGPLDFGLTGILSAVAAPLAQAGIPIFAISTFDTDYILVKADRCASACAALAAHGFPLHKY